jgi:hypothetical protein
MAYLASKLITRAWNLSGIVPRGLNVVGGDKMSLGLDLLNELLAIKTADTRLIPYFQEYSFNSVQGQEKYEIDNLLSIETLTFNIGTVRFTTMNMSRKQYFGSARANNVQSLPCYMHLERRKGGSDLYLYFLPSQIYPMKLWGKFGLDSVDSENVDLSEIYDMFYITYLIYGLAEYLCEYFNITLQPQVSEKLKEFEDQLKDISPPDITMQKLSTFNNQQMINYGVANFGPWRPS